MAVYERTYKRYKGALTAAWSRSFILPRYAFRNVFESKAFIAFFAFSFTYPVFCAALIYVLQNADLLLTLDIEIKELLAIDADFFKTFLVVQGWFAFLIALFIGPGLVSRDLANNALPLYLCRPFSRAEYVLGKFLVLAALLSAVTWVPGLLLFFLQGNLEGGGWMMSHLRIATGIFVGSWVWIAVVTLLALAFSAWVKWRAVAGFLMLFVLFNGNFFAFLFNQLFKTSAGDVLDLQRMISMVWSSLLGLELPSEPSAFAAWASLMIFSAFCLFLLHRKIRAYEVVS